MPNLSRWNGGIKYILVFICVLSKMLFLEPLKNKKSPTVVEGFKKIFGRMKIKPMRLQTDEGVFILFQRYISSFCFVLGGEFWSGEARSFYKRNNIWHFSSESRSVKASVAEVFAKLEKKFSSFQGLGWFEEVEHL